MVGNPRPETWGRLVGDSRPIFVVGPSRSGTALVRAMINGHPDVALAGETHYFDDLRTRIDDPSSPVVSADEQRRCEDYFLALSHRPFGHLGDPEKGWLTRQELELAARELGGSADSYFEAYCKQLAARDEARRWGEKTPRHIFRIADIVDRYPEARVVCMVRDPRAVIASYRGWKGDKGGFDLAGDPDHAATLAADSERARRTYDLLLLSLLWRSQAGAILKARRAFGPATVHVQRYEALVERPAEEVAALARFLDVDEVPEMLDVPVLNSSFEQFDSDGGVSRAPLHRWRTLLSDDEVGTIQRTCGSLMTQLGFELVPGRGTVVHTAVQWARLPVSAGRAALANRDRLGNPASYVWHRLTPLVGRRD